MLIVTHASDAPADAACLAAYCQHGAISHFRALCATITIRATKKAGATQIAPQQAR
jgi:hypothetical protein